MGIMEKKMETTTAVTEVNLSYYTGETIFTIIHIYPLWKLGLSSLTATQSSGKGLTMLGNYIALSMDNRKEMEITISLKGLAY